MDIFKVIGVGMTGVFLALAVKEQRRDIAVLISLATGMFIFFFVIDGVAAVIEGFNDIMDRSGIDSRYFYVIVKITGISYCTQFGAEVCRDAGEGAIASKIELAGKIVIMAMTLPIIKSFLDICISAIDKI